MKAKLAARPRMGLGWLGSAAAAVAALSLFASAAYANYRPSNDGRDRGVLIINTSPWTVTAIYARPRSGPQSIPGDRIPSNTIPPRWEQLVIFDDGYGACLYDITFVGSNGGNWRTTMDVCVTSQWTLR